jgi:hypothetical protein
VEDLGSVFLPGTPAASTPPAPTPTPVDHTLRLKKVTLPEGVTTTGNHGHDGVFVLSVQAGAICYRYLSPVETDADVTVTARMSSDVAVPEACQIDKTWSECGGPDGCVLEPGDAVYLPTGSSIEQEGDTTHRYGNVDTEEAIVYFAEYQKKDDDAGCAGSCP